jgi:ribosomal-protein-alanine N-acetyltransferase
VTLPIWTSRLSLRKFRLDDETAVHAFASDAEVTRYTGWYPRRPEETREMLDSWIAGTEKSISLAIELQEESKVIGWTGFTAIDRERESATFGYALHREYWGKGFASETARALVNWGFADLKLHRIIAKCSVENTPSVRVLEKLGMRREGHFLQDVKKYDQWHDTYLYAILRKEWHT